MVEKLKQFTADLSRILATPCGVEVHLDVVNKSIMPWVLWPN